MLKFLEKQGFFGLWVNMADRRYPTNRTPFWVTDWVTAAVLKAWSFVTQHAPDRP